MYKIITAKHTTKLLVGWKIAIDEGHGGSDPGAIDLVNNSEMDDINTVEKHLNDLTGDVVIEGLKTLGAEVIVTRNNDDTVSLRERADVANKAKADIFVSIHYNAYMKSAKGIETFHYPDSIFGKELATKIHLRLLNTGLQNRGVKTANFAVLRLSSMPAALVELGFITNPDEERKINTDEYRYKAAELIIDGIIDFCRENSRFRLK